METTNEIVKLSGRVHFVGDIVVLDKTQRQQVVMEINNKYKSKIGFSIWAGNCGRLHVDDQITACLSFDCKEGSISGSWVTRINCYHLTIL